MKPEDNKEIPIRFVIDEHFISYILQDKDSAITLLMELSKIHTLSKHYPLQHNVMFDQSFKNSIKDKKIRGSAILGAIHPVPYPSFVEEETDFESKLIRYAINLASRKPYKIVILTSKEQSEKYIENKHYQDPTVRSTITICSDKNAQKLIKLVHDMTFSKNNRDY